MEKLLRESFAREWAGAVFDERDVHALSRHMFLHTGKKNNRVFERCVPTTPGFVAPSSVGVHAQSATDARTDNSFPIFRTRCRPSAHAVTCVTQCAAWRLCVQSVQYRAFGTERVVQSV
eukprot:1189348-Prorocentrum_minimum.AAC.3